jgi:hypothetical protein
MSSARYFPRNESPTPSGPLRRRAKPNYSGNFPLAIDTESSLGQDPGKTAIPASISASAGNQAPSTFAHANAVDWTNVPSSPHTPPNAPRRARDKNHTTYITVNQTLYRKLYKEFRKDFKRKGLVLTHAAVLRFAQKSLAEQKITLAQRNRERRQMFNYNAARNEEIEELNEENQRLKRAVAGLARTIKRLSAKLEAKEGQIFQQGIELKQHGKFIKAQDKIIPEQEYEIEEQGTMIKEEKAQIIEQGKRIGCLEELLMEHGWDKGSLEDAVARMDEGESAMEAKKALEQAE